MHLTNKSLEVKQIDSIYIWTDPLINNATIMIDRQPLLSRNSLLYISIIRGTFTGFINTTNNFDFELHTSKPKFIAKGVVGNRSSSVSSFFSKAML